ncbi:MAG: hypothetical protein ACOYD4_06890 [Solirubrobacterales bacterium]
MALKYIGGGTYFPGVPARDLDDKEEAEYGERIAEQQAVAGRVLYEVVKKEGGKPQGKPQEDKD